MKSKNIKNQKTIVENSDMTNENSIPLKAPPKEFRIDSRNFEEFCKLEPDFSAKTIVKNDLPNEFSKETRDFIDLFRQKTVKECNEWEFYIDYENNKIIHCIYGGLTQVKGWINAKLMKNRQILSIHNHPPQELTPHHLQQILKF